MRTTTFLLCLFTVGFGVAGCAGSAPVEPEARAAAVDAVLGDPSAEDGYRTSTRCLATHRYDSVDVIDEGLLVFRGSGERIWLNQLRTRCPGLKSSDVLEFELHENRACALDMFTVVDRMFLVWRRAGPTCVLGEFEPISAAQLEAIQAAVNQLD